MVKSAVSYAVKSCVTPVGRSLHSNFSDPRMRFKTVLFPTPRVPIARTMGLLLLVLSTILFNNKSINRELNLIQ